APGQLARHRAAPEDARAVRPRRGGAAHRPDGGGPGRRGDPCRAPAPGRRGRHRPRGRRRRALDRLLADRLGEDRRRLGRGAQGVERMNAEMIAALRELEREKGIAFETILQGLEEAMAAAYKTAWKQENPTADDDFVGFR